MYILFETNIHRKGIVRPQSEQFPHCVYMDDLHISTIKLPSAYSAAEKYVGRV
jgi:hypothetical protein